MKPVRRSYRSLLLLAVLVLALSLLASTASAGAPPARISYQGLVKVNGVPYDGTGYFKFWIVNAATGDGTSYWQTGPEALTVSNGLFDFMLGSTTALPSSVLDNDPIYLRVWFSQSSGGPFQALEPNQRIGSVAYALRAEHATTAGNADTVDSQHASAFAASSHNHSGAAITSGTIALARLPAIPWSQLSSVPAGLNDGDNDTLGGLSCADGQVAQFDGTLWACASVAGVTDHGALTGLADDDHPQYFNLGQNETVTGIPAFNGGTSGTNAPFSVDSTDLVTNLDADLLDGQHASELAMLSHGHSGADITSGTIANARLNTGAGNGLDADLLDGQHAEAFASSSHDHDARYVNQGQAASVTSAMLVDAAVTSAQIADGAITFAKIAQNGCAAGQIAKWNGTMWACAADGGTTYAAGSNLTLSSNTFALAPNVSVSGDLGVAGTTSLTGRLGVGTSSPATALDVVGDVSATGYVKVGASAATCDASMNGAVRRNGSSLELCDGAAWQPLQVAQKPIVMYEAQGYTPIQGYAIGGRSGGDTKCSAAPNRPPGYSRFRAFLSVSATDEIRSMPNLFGVPKMVPVISLTDKIVANNWYDLFDGNINQTLYSAGVLPASAFWWAGSNADGSLYTDGHCSGWTSSSVSGRIGSSIYADLNWLSSGTPACSNSYRLVCIAY